MAKEKKRNLLNVVQNDTCFAAHTRYDVDCMKKSCRNWINCEQHHNCAMIGAQKGPMTLQEIGDIYSLTRMRICQIEKSIYRKVSSQIKQLDEI